MKKIYLSRILLSVLFLMIGGIHKSKAASIDSRDTVTFDLSQAVIFGNTIEFPVSVYVYDLINSLDFSFKYNHTNVEFDSIIDRTNYIQPFYYYNTNDSTVRFTSSSLVSFSNDTIVSVRFTLLGIQIHVSDLIDLKVRLNGDLCGIKVINPVSTGIKDIQGIANEINVFPNPVSGFLNIESSENAEYQMTDLNGKLLLSSEKLWRNQKQEIDIHTFQNGIYFLKFSNIKGDLIKKVVIEN